MSDAMAANKKRKRDEGEIEYPLITYDAANRTFDRLFKEESLKEMKDVVRKKLGLSTDVSVYLAQIRDGRSVDLEDDDDFAAFRTVAHFSNVATVKVILGGNTPNSLPMSNGTTVPQTPKAKKKQKKYNALAPEIHSASGAGSTFDERSASPPHKKRRVSFIDPPTDALSDASVLFPDTPRKQKAPAESPPQEETLSISQLPSANGEVCSTSKKKKKKRKNRKELQNGQTDTSSAATQITATLNPHPPPARDELTTEKSKKKKRRLDSEDSDAEEQPVTFAAAIDAQRSANEEEEESRPAKKPKKKPIQTTDEPVSKKSSRPKFVPSETVKPTATHAASKLALGPGDGEPEGTSTKVKKSHKKKDREESEIPSKTIEQPQAGPSRTEEQEDEVDDQSKKKKKKKKDKPKDIAVDEEPPAEATKASSSSLKSTQIDGETEKDSEHRQTPNSSDPSEDDPPTKKPKKSSKKETAKSKEPEEVQQPEEDANAESKTKGKKRKTDKAAANNEEHDRDEPESAATVQARESEKAAVAAAIQAMLARKTAAKPDGTPLAAGASPATKPVVPATTSPEPPVPEQPSKAAEPEKTATPESVLEPTVEKDTPASKPVAPLTKPPKKTKPTSCPICDKTPFHAKTNCPIIKSGIRAMRKRLEELELEVEDDEEKKEHRSAAMTELQTRIEKKSKQSKTSTGSVAKKAKDKVRVVKRAKGRDEGSDDVDEDRVQVEQAKGPKKTSPSTVDEDEGDKEEEEEEGEEDKNEENMVQEAKIKSAEKVKGEEKPKPKPKAKAKEKAKIQEDSESSSEDESDEEDDLKGKTNGPQKQVEVVASTPARVVDVHPRSSIPPPASFPEPPTNLRPLPSTQPFPRRLGPLTSTPRPSSQPLSSKRAAPLLQALSQTKGTPFQTSSEDLIGGFAGDMSMLGDLSQLTEKDMESLVFPKVSIADVPSSDEDEDDEAEKLEDDPMQEEEDDVERQTPKKFGPGTRYSSSSDEEDDDEDDEPASRRSPSKSPSLEPLVEVDDTPKRRSVSKVPVVDEVTTSFKEMEAQGSSREVDTAGNDAFEDPIATDLGPVGLAASINKAMEVDSDTAVASNGEDSPERSSTDKPTNRGKVRQSLDPIEPSDENERSPEVDPIVSDDGTRPHRPARKVEVVIRTQPPGKKTTRSSSNGSAKTGEPVGPTPGKRKVKKMKRLSEYPTPSMRVIKSSPTSAATPATRGAHGRKSAAEQGSQASGALLPDEADSEGQLPQTQTTTRSGRVSRSTAKTTKTPGIASSKKSTTPAAKPASKIAAPPVTKPPSITSKTVVTGTAMVTTKAAKSKVTLMDPEIPEEGENEHSESFVIGPQWSTLGVKESSPSSDTSAQPDELHHPSSPSNPPVENSNIQPSSPDHLFLPSETQLSFPYSQFPVTPGSQQPTNRKLPSKDSDDENEVVKTVTKPPRPSQFRGLSEFKSSQLFTFPKLQRNSENTTPQKDLYGRNQEQGDKSESDSDSDSDSDSQSADHPLHSQHIDPSRQAGFSTSKRN